ncbi:MAG TPA: hypothetical protein VFL79_01085 [Terriglobia bacterium]|nr:hypothetical protein [Terriglobia bacterium]
MPRSQSPYAMDEREDAPGCVVLIFSTDRGFLIRYCEMAISMGFKPLTASTPEAATALLRLLVMSLVVLDQESGTAECCQILRRARDLQYYAPVLVIARASDSNFRHEALSLGAENYLDHPALPDDIIHALLPNCNHRERPDSSIAFQAGTHGGGIQ